MSQALSLVRTLGALATLAALAGCGGETGSQLAACRYDFEATVRMGPSAPLTLQGPLTLYGDETGAYGYIAPKGSSDKVPVTAAYEGSDISLRFLLKDGTSIRGKGPSGGALAQCKGQMLGALTGPKAGDQGDWLANATELINMALMCQQRCYLHRPLPDSCGNLCRISGYAQGSTAYTTCYNDCVSGPAVYYCDDTATFFDVCKL